MSLRKLFILCALVASSMIVGCPSDSKNNGVDDSGTASNDDAGVDGESGTNGGGAGTSSVGVPSDSAWFCTDVSVGDGNACSCVLAKGIASQDTCTKPKPTCCFEVLSQGELSGCQCWPSDSATCSAKGTPDYPAVATCPPP